MLPLAQQYLKPVKFVFPLFLLGQMLAAFLRNDNDPALATVAVMSGGLFNVFGDWIFVFPCKMGRKETNVMSGAVYNEGRVMGKESDCGKESWYP